MPTLTEQVKNQAIALGFSHVGVAAARALEPEGGRLSAWLARGFHAGMKWMERSPERRIDPRNVLRGAKSVIVVAMNYYTDVSHPEAPGTGKISRYAWGDDYHDIVGTRLDRLKTWLRERAPSAEALAYVDTGPVMEKAWAARAGVGWIGKHGNVITRNMGSWVFLGVIITTLELDPDGPATDHCGTCTRCIEACPTDAIVLPGVVDSARCISYLTIEHRGEIAGDVAGQFEGWIYGCDICQDVCPWNVKFATPTSEPGFRPREGNRAPVLDAWAAMDASEFSRRFSKSPIKRTKLAGLLRNVAVALRGGDPREGRTASHEDREHRT
jgi:epoxyqueuosine reductase